ncbi:MAG TPA: hypothetical protein VG077_18965 [Verrucomicrobiae bacterium]|nr:hypothetical protein [Verrucomicrobiae bacterium]
MHLVVSPTEITTSVTDTVLAIECVVVLVCLWRTPTGDRWRIGVWCWVFGLLALVSVLGSVAHGLEIPHSLRVALWKPLYLSLGLLVALFLVGAFFDWRGRIVAGRLVPCSLGAGAVFFGLTEFLDGGFVIFLVYEAVAMAGALAIYSFLAVTHRLRGAGIVAAAIVMNLAAAAVQASSLSVRICVSFDHNGVFHLIQMLAIAVLGLGLYLGLKPGAQRMISESSVAANGSQPIS